MRGTHSPQNSLQEGGKRLHKTYITKWFGQNHRLAKSVCTSGTFHICYSLNESWICLNFEILLLSRTFQKKIKIHREVLPPLNIFDTQRGKKQYIFEPLAKGTVSFNIRVGKLHNQGTKALKKS